MLCDVYDYVILRIPCNMVMGLFIVNYDLFSYLKNGLINRYKNYVLYCSYYVQFNGNHTSSS